MDKKQNENEKEFLIEDLSGGMQAASTEFLSKQNEVEYAGNTDFGKVGAISKSLGYLQRENDLTSSTSTSTSSSTTTTSTSTSTSSSTSTSTTTTA
ncbi:hypothetical protein M0R04_16475 [Candidatus Dojkabacteria bacterium]|jgi:hypothetical protein|nr:hypothetical protein [Candidatus Dojkabacteria bacterium]